MFFRGKQKIKYGKRKIRDVKGYDSGKLERLGPYGRKIKAALYGNKPGMLSKSYYRAICSWVKTKARNGYASHRHKGTYGKAVLYSRYDRRHVEQMKMAEAEYRNKTEYADANTKEGIYGESTVEN